MRIEPSTLKACSTELAPECALAIEKLRRQEGSTPSDYAAVLEQLTEWSSVLGKTEMSRWVHVLNDCDAILEAATAISEDGAHSMAVDESEEWERPVAAALRFTCLLFENTFSRSVYRSMERLQLLLDSRKMNIVVQTLRLLLVISKSSRYITHHVQEADRRCLQMKLIANTEESWNTEGKGKPLTMVELCATSLPNEEVVLSELRNITFHTSAGTSRQFTASVGVTYEEAKVALTQMLHSPTEEVDETEQVLALTKLRLAYSFGAQDFRIHSLMARLISVSVLFYSRSLLDEWRINCLASDAMIEQSCALLQVPCLGVNDHLVDALRTEALKTLAGIVFLEKPGKIQLVVDCLGLSSYHGITPTLVRACVEKLGSGTLVADTQSSRAEYSVSFITSLFSLIYHLAGYDSGGTALVRSSMISSLLGVVKIHTLPDSQISFVTRAVRIIDNLTAIEVQEFNTNDGMSVIVERFVHEVSVCRKHIEESQGDLAISPMSIVCHQQRTALMKSLMNFLKRAIVDTNYAAQVRRIMECELPTALSHLVQNPQYYGSSLIYCSIHLTTSFIYQEPAQLTSLQDKGLTDALLDAIFNEKFPVSRDIVNGLPNICSALCLNERGLKAFNERQPCERIFRIIFSTKFLLSMRKRKSEIQECATTLGASFDELMRHQPTLRKELITSLAKVVDSILSVGRGGAPSSTEAPSSSTAHAVPEQHVQIIWSVGKNVSEESMDIFDERNFSPEKKVPAINSTATSFQFCFQQADGSLVLPLADYAVMLGTLCDVILNNRAPQENSNLMLEVGLPKLLIQLLDFPRPYPPVLLWHYLHNLASVLRQISFQTSKPEVFEPLITQLLRQLHSIRQGAESSPLGGRERLHLLNKMGSLLMVLSNFLTKATSATTSVHDIRALLLHYFTSSDAGKELIHQLFECYAEMNWNLLAMNAQPPGQLPPTPYSRVSVGVNTTPITITPSVDSAGVEISPLPPLQSPTDTIGTTSEQQMDQQTVQSESTPNSKRSMANAEALERTIHSTTARVHRQLGELIYLFGKTFCFGAINRPRRGVIVGLTDASQCRTAQRQMAETLFNGMNRLMVIDEERLQGAWSGAHIANVLSILKHLLFDDPQGHNFLRPFFYKTHCHRAFFALGEWLAEHVGRAELSAGLSNWLSIMQRLVSTTGNMQQPQQQGGRAARVEPRSLIEGFDWNKYLGVTHNQALQTLIQLFKAANSQGQENTKLVERVLSAVQVLVRGAVQLHESEKKAAGGGGESSIELDALLNEIDTEKVQQLVDMGFSQSEAVDALLIYNSVPEAAEYLMDQQQQQQSHHTSATPSTFNTPQRAVANDAQQQQQPQLTPAPPLPSPPTAAANPTPTTEATAPAGTEQQQEAGSSSGVGSGVGAEEQEPVEMRMGENEEGQRGEVGLNVEGIHPQGSGEEAAGSAEPMQQLEASTSMQSSTSTFTTPVQQGAETMMDTTEPPPPPSPPLTSSQLGAAQSLFGGSQPSTSEASMASTSSAAAKVTTSLSADNFSQMLEELREAKPFDFKEAIGQICSGVVPDCLALVERDETLIYSIAELATVLVSDSTAATLVEETLIKPLIDDLDAELGVLLEKQEVDEEKMKRFRYLLHLFCLLWSTFDTVKLYSKLKSTFFPGVVELMSGVVMSKEKDSLDSKLVPPILLFVDLYERERRLDLRQQLFNTSVEHVQWCYHVNEQRYDSPAEWRDYPAMCSAQLNRAFREGKSTVKITMNEGKNYVIDFTEMTQQMLNPSDGASTTSQTVRIHAKARLNPAFEPQQLYDNEKAIDEAGELHKRLVKLLVGMLKSSQSPLPSQLAYSLLSLLLRLLSMRGTMEEFIKDDGIGTLLRLECKEKPYMIPRMIALICRLCIDDSESMKRSFERVVRSALSPSTIAFSLSEPSSQSRTWMQRTRRNEKEWKRMMRMLAPLAARSPRTHLELMDEIVWLRNDEMTLSPEASAADDKEASPEKKNKERRSSAPSGDVSAAKQLLSPQASECMGEMLNTVVEQLLSTDWDKMRNRVLRPSALLKLLAELVRSYPSVSITLLERSHEKKSLLHWVMDKFLLQCVPSLVLFPTTDAQLEAAEANGTMTRGWFCLEEVMDTSRSAKALLSNLIAASPPQASGKAGEMSVAEVKSLLHSTINEYRQQQQQHPQQGEQLEADGKQVTASLRQLCEKVSTLARLVLLLKESSTQASSAPTNARQDAQPPQKQQYSFLRQIHKKNLLIDFAKSIWHLPIKEKAAAETANVILRMLEAIARDVCQAIVVTSSSSSGGTPSSVAATSTTPSTSTQPGTAPTGNEVAPTTSNDSEQSGGGTQADTTPRAATTAAQGVGTEEQSAGVLDESANVGGMGDELQNADVEMADFELDQQVSMDYPVANAEEGEFDQEDEDMQQPGEAAVPHHFGIYQVHHADHHDGAHEAMEDDHQEEEDAYSTASSDSSDEGSAGQGAGGGDGPENIHEDGSDNSSASEDGEERGEHGDAHMEIAVEVDGVNVGDAPPPRSRHLAGRSSTPSIALEPMPMDDEVEDDEDDEEHEIHHAINAANPNHAAPMDDDPDDEVDDEEDGEDEEEEVDEDDEDGVEGQDYDDDEVDFDLVDLIDSTEGFSTGEALGGAVGFDGALNRLGGDIARLTDEVANLDRLMVAMQHQRQHGGRMLGHNHQAAHFNTQQLGNLAHYVTNLLGRMRVPGASAVVDAGDGRRFRLLTVNPADGSGAHMAATGGVAAGFPPDLYRLPGAGGDGGAAGGAMGEHPLLRRPLPSLSLALPPVDGMVAGAPNAANQQQQAPHAAPVQGQQPQQQQVAIRIEADANQPMNLLEFLQSDEAMQRMVTHHAATNGRGGRAQHQMVGGLRRQGALRRWHPVAGFGDVVDFTHGGMQPVRGGGAHRLLARVVGGDGALYDHQHHYGGQGDGETAGTGMEVTAERRAIDSLIPYYYDRVFDHVRLIDSASTHYVSVLVTSYLTDRAMQREQLRKEEEAKKRREEEQEALKKAAEEEARKQAEQEAAEAEKKKERAEEQEEQVTEEAATNEGEVGMMEEPVVAPPPSSSGVGTPGNGEGEEDERHSAGGSIDSSSELSTRFAVLIPTATTDDESTRDSTATAVVQPEQDVSAGTEQRSTAPDTEQTTVSADQGISATINESAGSGDTIVEGIEQSITGAVEVAEETPAPQDQAADVAMAGEDEPSTMEDYQAILGDITVPEGVDPAFLAALPEELRQEVLRDHTRQQRDQRINTAQPARQTTASSSSSASSGQATTAPAAAESDQQQQQESAQQQQLADGTDAVPDAQQPQGNEQPAQQEPPQDDSLVLDEEFLNALPPELQEEVLREHEQRIAQRNRQAQAAEAAGGAGASGAGGDTAAADNAAEMVALFETMPPGLRAQVLADIDDSVVAYLPANLQAEANRLRASLNQQHAFRIALGEQNRQANAAAARQPAAARAVPGRFYAAGDGLYGQPTAGDMERGVQVFDREAVATILLLYFLDSERFNHNRLQKLLKLICAHPGTCDYVVWCLLSLLRGLDHAENEATAVETRLDDEASSITGWIGTQFLVQTPLNHHEKVLRFLNSSEVFIHPLVRATICGRVLDTLSFMTRNFPHHFLPDKIRLPPNSTKRWDPTPEINHFWATAKSIDNHSNEEAKPTTSKASSQGMKEMIAGSLEQSPLAHLMAMPASPLIKHNATLMGKCVKILQTIAQSIPAGCQGRVPDESIRWLMGRIKEIANLMLDSCPEQDGLESVKGFLLELLRMLPEQRTTLFATLYSIVKEQSVRLHKDITTLGDELARVESSTKQASSQQEMVEAGQPQPTPPSAAAGQPLPASTVQQLPTLRHFTGRNSQAKKLLKSLEVISYLRNKQRALDQHRKRAAAAAVAQAKEKEEKGKGAEAAGASQPQQPQAYDEVEAAEVLNLRDMLESMEPMWESLSACLEQMSLKLDSHAVLSLQHAAEAFFLAHAFSIPEGTGGGETTSADGGSSAAAAPASAESTTTASMAVEEPQQPSTSAASRPMPRLDHDKYRQSMFTFAERHRSVLNQILRGNANNLMEDSAMHILTYFPKLLDFDVKRKYFYREVRRMESRERYHHEDVAVRVRRAHLFSDSFRELFRLRGAEWKSRFYIIFEGEEGQDAGGLLREWYSVITKEVFNPNYALFITSPGDRVTHMINKSSYVNPEHLEYFKFIGRVIAKAIFDNKQLDCYFTRAFYKHILSVPVRYQDIESEDPSYFKSLEFLLTNPLELIGSELTFSVEVEEFGERSLRDLKEGGSKILVTDKQKEEYVQLVCQMKMTGSIRRQLDAFLEGFYDIIPKKLISIFNEQELELLISGMPEIDIDDLCANTDYKGTYTRTSPQIQWFWRSLRSFEKEDLAKFLQFVTGTSKVPLQGFAQLEGMNGVQKFTIHMDSRSNDRLPSAHTCFNQLDLPCYESYEQLRRQLLLAVRECHEGFAFA